MQQRKGILLVNLGTPDSPGVSDVRKYLKEFLLDERVIDIPALPRHLLVRGIIAPFRAPKSAALYQKIWTTEGSPLMVNSVKLQKKLQQYLGDDFVVVLAMRYQQPTIEAGIRALMDEKVSSITIVPLFPQYASASNGSVIQKVMEIMGRMVNIPALHVTGSFYDHPLFIQAFAESAGAMYIPEYDHILFSYHGLPERQITKAAAGNACLSNGCCDTLHGGNAHCYRAQCFETSRLIAAQLHIPKEKYTVCFQSRLGKTPWIQPYSVEVIHQLATSGTKRILAFSPAFVADCLETLYEISEEYNTEFKKLGGESITLVPSLNDSDTFVKCLVEMVRAGQ